LQPTVQLLLLALELVRDLPVETPVPGLYLWRSRLLIVLAFATYLGDRVPGSTIPHARAEALFGPRVPVKTIRT
jgi:hypothetical protein